MQGLIDAILKFIRALFGGQNEPSGEGDCQITDVEIPAEQTPIMTEDSLPQIIEAQAAVPAVTIKTNLSRAHIYTDMSMTSTPLLITKGGATFGLEEATPKDVDGYGWYKVRVAQKVGWIRSELVLLNQTSSSIPNIVASDIPDPAPPPRSPAATKRFAVPVTGKFSQGYTSAHRGNDFAVAMGTPVRAAADGVIIRSVACENCANRTKPNIYPCGQTIYNNAAWGYGYGNFVVIRHDYAQMPPEMRTQMDRLSLKNGFVYVLYAHFSRLNVKVGQFVTTGHVLGLTGNHGCSSAPHLHFEVRVGTVDIVDNIWAGQRSLNPTLMFDR